MTSCPIHVVGGGIAGLATALGLARIGRPSVVLERAPAFEEAGAGLQLGPNAVRALQWLGAWDAAAASAVAPEAIQIVDGATGGTLQRISLGAAFSRRFGEAYRVVRRADLLKALHSVATGSSLVELRAATPVRQLPQASAVIGADGIRSTVRALLGHTTSPRFRGHVIHRALPPHAEAERLVRLWLCPGGHLVQYPLADGRLNLVAVAEGDWTSEGWSEHAASADVLSAFSRCCPAVLETLALAPDWHKWAAADLPRLTGWGSGPRTLVGDAAHAALPYLAQGAAMALEDGVILGRSLAANSDAAAAFRIYETARRARTGKVQTASSRLGPVYHASGVMRQARNLALRFAGSERFLDRLAWLYAYDPATA